MPSSSSQTDILIVGAGPVGLMAACQLQRFGVEHRLIDRRNEPNKKSKAAGIWCRSMDVFESLGLAELFADQGNHAHAFNLHSKGKKIGGLDLSEIKSRYNYLLILPQDKTEQILRDHYTKQGGRIEWHTELTELAQNEDEVFATLDSKGDVSTVHCQYLIGCDGIGSTVRELLQQPFEGKAIAADWLVGDLTVDGPIDEDSGSAFFHEDGPCVFFPMGNKRHRVIAMIQERSDEDPTLEFFQQLLDKRTHRPLELSEPRDLAYFNIQERQVKDYRVGRCFFAGDAAHVHSPAGGQGMNTGIQDAHNLAWKLALVLQMGIQNETLVDSYHAERHPVAEEVLGSTGRATHFIMLRSPLLQTMRNHALSVLTSLPLVQSKGRDALSELRINYREGPLSQCDNNGWMHKHFAQEDIKPGDYCPAVNLVESDSEKSVRMAQVISPGSFHLLLFVGDNEKSLNKLAELAKEVSSIYPKWVTPHIIGKAASAFQCLDWDGTGLIDMNGSAHEAYKAHEPTACLVRPDGYIAYIRHEPSAEQVKAYFDTIGVAAIEES